VAEATVGIVTLHTPVSPSNLFTPHLCSHIMQFFSSLRKSGFIIIIPCFIEYHPINHKRGNSALDSFYHLLSELIVFGVSHLTVNNQPFRIFDILILPGLRVPRLFI
jgi:hypothetical protein